jgi:PEGA domain-containing protein
LKRRGSLSVRPLLTLVAGIAGALGFAPAAVAQPPSETRSDDPKLTEARELYVRGLRLVKQAQWAEALAMFERSRALRPHALTTYNIGACERALGRYTRALSRLNEALTENERSHVLPPSILDEARGFVAEIERLLVHLELEVVPADAGIAVDGRPLSPTKTGSKPVLVAGIAPPGPPTAPPHSAFELVLDPGTHLFTLRRRGYADAVANKTFGAAHRGKLRLELAQLPATIRISSNRRGALVSVGGKDVGPAPVDVLRPPGVYLVEVMKEDYVPYRAEVRVNAGEESMLTAPLALEQQPLTKKWWFWTAAAVVVGGVAVGTYFATRPEPESRRPPLDGGSLDWVAPIP